HRITSSYPPKFSDFVGFLISRWQNLSIIGSSLTFALRSKQNFVKTFVPSRLPFRYRKFSADSGKIPRGIHSQCSTLSAMATTSPRHDSALPRVLCPWMTTAVVIGTVIGSGVFKKPAAVARDVPEFIPAMGVWVLGGLLALIGALVLAEVAVL